MSRDIVTCLCLRKKREFWQDTHRCVPIMCKGAHTLCLGLKEQHAKCIDGGKKKYFIDYRLFLCVFASQLVCRGRLMLWLDAQPS